MFLTVTQPNRQAISINPDRISHYERSYDDPSKTVLAFDSGETRIILMSAENFTAALSMSGIDVIDTDQIAFPEKQQ